MSTPHNTARKEDIAKVVLMPGDPLRAKFIAETYLENAKQVNSVRNMFGYTGTYKGVPVTVFGSGMGMPSIGIYSYELFSQYDVEKIIRIGSAGGYTKEVDVYDVVLAESAWSESSYALTQSGCTDTTIYPSKELNDQLIAASKKLNKPMHIGKVHSSDVFYREAYAPNDAVKNGCVCVEMESFALFHNANVLGKKAACVLTISDSFVSDVVTTPEERQLSFTNMMEIALEAAIQ
ncbi:MAG: purine-nucleoside phosphorylase [Erysipelotrichaceae bacterium]|nr:purine-nucleoside phosphorylase [Erysipelotrichaceae bacterium]